MADKQVPATYIEVMEGQHVFHGMIARVLEKVGGEVFIQEWAEDNPGAFIRLAASMAPRVQPAAIHQGDINITVNGGLGRTALDGIIEGQCEEVIQG